MNRAERKEAGEALKGILAAPDRVQGSVKRIGSRRN